MKNISVNSNDLVDAVNGLNYEVSESSGKIYIELSKFVQGTHDLVSWGLIYGDLEYTREKAIRLLRILEFMRKSGKSWETLESSIQETKNTIRYIGGLMALCKVYLEE